MIPSPRKDASATSAIAAGAVRPVILRAKLFMAQFPQMSPSPRKDASATSATAAIAARAEIPFTSTFIVLFLLARG
jgi:hypothetical protein